MYRLDAVGEWLHDELPRLLGRHGVPGAAVAVSRGDDVVDVAAGVLNRATGVTATTDSLFQIGSITKVWTATLAMQLVDEGALDLDAPVRRYLPDFALADEDAAARITVRQLMCHVAGFEGDVFTDTGKGDDRVARYVHRLRDVPQLYPPGAMFSYNNAAFCVLGRVVEVLRERPFDDCVRDHLFTPLGLSHAANDPYEAILHRAALGHLRRAADADPEPAPAWTTVPSNSPAGAMLAMRPRDLLTFVRTHLSGGVGPDGRRVLSAASVQAMQERQVELPGDGLGDAWGLGWEIVDAPGGPVIGHDGATVGQWAYLRVVPEREVAVTVLVNGGPARPVFRAIGARVLRELAGVELPPAPVPDLSPAPFDASRVVGTYRSSMAETVVDRDDAGRVWLEQTPTPVAVGLGDQPYRTELVGWRGDTLLTAEPENGEHTPYAFLGGPARGPAAFLHDGRAHPRSS